MVKHQVNHYRQKNNLKSNLESTRPALPIKSEFPIRWVSIETYACLKCWSTAADGSVVSWDN